MVTRPSALTATDAAAATALANGVGWNDTIADWEALFRCSTVFGCRDDGGALVATGALSDFGGCATIAKVVVREDVRRRGLARAVLERCLEARTDPSVPTLLVATPLGLPLYERAGFVPVETIHVFLGALARPGGAGRARIEPFAQTDRDAALALDETATGGARGRMLDARLESASRALVVRGARDGREDGELRAFGLATVQRDIVVMGPVVAVDAATALDVIDALGRGAPRVRIDVPASQRAVVDALTAAGLPIAGSRPEMALGGRLPRRDGMLRFALASQAYG